MCSVEYRKSLISGPGRPILKGTVEAFTCLKKDIGANGLH
jgi:hypothetical protein